MTAKKGFVQAVRDGFAGHLGKKLLAETAKKLPDIEKCRRLIRRGADVDCLDDKRKTPLIIAASMGHEDIAVLLIESGAKKLDHWSVDCQTAMAAAVSKTCPKIVAALLKGGLDPDLNIDTHPNTALSMAVLRCMPDIVDILIAGGADVNAPTKGHLTPLHVAVIAYRGAHRELALPVVQKLLDAGADTMLKNDKGETAEEYDRYFNPPHAIADKIAVFKNQAAQRLTDAAHRGADYDQETAPMPQMTKKPFKPGASP